MSRKIVGEELSTLLRKSSFLICKTIFCGLIFLGFIEPLMAEDFSTLSDHKELVGHVIVDVGSIKKLDPPGGMSSSRDRLQLNDRCFEVSDYLGYWGYGNKAGALIKSQDDSEKMAFFASDINSIKVGVVRVQRVGCTFQSSDEQSPDEIIENLRQQSEIRNQRIERLERQLGKR